MNFLFEAELHSCLKARETDAFGNAIREVRSPTGQLPVTRSFDARTGRIQTMCAGSTCQLVNEAYPWDGAGNLHTHANATNA